MQKTDNNIKGIDLHLFIKIDAKHEDAFRCKILDALNAMDEVFDAEFD